MALSKYQYAPLLELLEKRELLTAQQLITNDQLDTFGPLQVKLSVDWENDAQISVTEAAIRNLKDGQSNRLEASVPTMDGEHIDMTVEIALVSAEFLTSLELSRRDAGREMLETLLNAETLGNDEWHDTLRTLLDGLSDVLGPELESVQAGDVELAMEMVVDIGRHLESADAITVPDVLGPLSAVISDELRSEQASGSELAQEAMRAIASHAGNEWVAWAGLGENRYRQLDAGEFMTFVDASDKEALPGFQVEIDEPSIVWITQDLSNEAKDASDGGGFSVSASGVASGNGPQTTSVSIAPSQDARVHYSGSVDESGNSLSVRNGVYESFLTFDLSTIPVDFESATLELDRSSGSVGTITTDVVDLWDENSISWNNRPATQDPGVANWTGSQATVNANVTEAVRRARLLGDANFNGDRDAEPPTHDGWNDVVAIDYAIKSNSDIRFDGEYSLRYGVEPQTSAIALSRLDFDNDGQVSSSDGLSLLAATGVAVGDTDFDGETGFSDFLDLSNNFGLESALYTEGDLDFDAIVGFSDFTRHSSGYGSTATSPAPQDIAFRLRSSSSSQVDYFSSESTATPVLSITSTVPDIVATDFYGNGGNAIVSYQILDASVPSFEISVHESLDGNAVGSLLGTHRVVSGRELGVGMHSARFQLETPVSPGIDHLVARLDTDSEITESNEFNNNHYFNGGLGDVQGFPIEFGPPGAVGPLAAEVIENDTVRVSWNDVPDATGYMIARATVNPLSGDYHWDFVGSVEKGTTTFTDEGLLANSRYAYKVHAFNAHGLSNEGFYAFATLPAPEWVALGGYTGVGLQSNYGATLLHNTPELFPWAIHNGQLARFEWGQFSSEINSGDTFQIGFTTGTNHVPDLDDLVSVQWVTPTFHHTSSTLPDTQFTAALSVPHPPDAAPIFMVNSGDQDADGIPDNVDYSSPSSDGAFPRIELTYEGDTPDEVSFYYDASFPNNSRTFSNTYNGQVLHVPEAGAYRIWTKPASEPRDPVTDFVVPGQSYPPSTEFYLEGVRAGASEIEIVTVTQGVARLENLDAWVIDLELVDIGSQGQPIPVTEIKESIVSPAIHPLIFDIYDVREEIVDGKSLILADVDLEGWVDYESPTQTPSGELILSNGNKHYVVPYDSNTGDFDTFVTDVVVHEGFNRLALYIQDTGVNLPGIIDEIDLCEAPTECFDVDGLQGVSELSFNIDENFQVTDKKQSAGSSGSDKNTHALRIQGLDQVSPHGNVQVGFPGLDPSASDDIARDIGYFNTGANQAGYYVKDGALDRAARITHRLVKFNHDLYTNPANLYDYAEGFTEGFVEDGFIGTFEGAWAIGKGTIDYSKKSVKYHLNPVIKLWGGTPYEVSFEKEGEFLYNGYEFGKKAAQIIGEVADDVTTFQYETIEALLLGDHDRLAQQSQTIVDAFRLAGGLILDLADYITAEDNLTPGNVGKIHGMIAYMAVETVLTSGAGLAAKAGKFGQVAKLFLTKVDDLAKSGALPSIVSDVLIKFGHKLDDGTIAASRLAYRLHDKFCFTRDTLVHTEFGTKPIGEIEVGERVYAFNFAIGDWVLCNVIDRHDNVVTGNMIRIDAGDEEIEVTENHPFWVIEGEDLANRRTPDHLAAGEDEGKELAGRWVDSQDIRPSDVFLGRDGRHHVVANVESSFTHDVEVSNLSIEEHHSFAVGILGILVHNASFCGILRASTNAAIPKKAPPGLVNQAKKWVLRNRPDLGKVLPDGSILVKAGKADELTAVAMKRIHGHHIVQKRVPKMYNKKPKYSGGTKPISEFDAPLDSWTKSEKSAWYIGQTHDLIGDLNPAISLLDDSSDALTLAEAGDRLHNLTWAINGDELHTWKSQKAVFERIQEAIELNEGTEGVQNVLIEIGSELANGQKLF